jgi:D-alanyl-D-alanine carboxypeptidase
MAADDRFEPASLTKLMSAYLVFAAIRDRKLDPAARERLRARVEGSGSRTVHRARKPSSRART